MPVSRHDAAIYDRDILLLPDSRLAHDTHRKTRPFWHRLLGRVEMTACFCVNCGAPGGLAINLPFMFYLCDGCEKWGKLPVSEVPENIARGADVPRER